MEAIESNGRQLFPIARNWSLRNGGLMNLCTYSLRSSGTQALRNLKKTTTDTIEKG
ncbi:hypothetical protein FHS86_003269 [Roseimarinus sediminis]